MGGKDDENDHKKKKAKEKKRRRETHTSFNLESLLMTVYDNVYL